MEGADSLMKPQRLGSPHHTSPSKSFSHFIYKAVGVSVFLVVLPLFPTQAPEFISPTLHTRSWELLQLVFVGIAITFGLFSRRVDETEKEHSSNFDNAQSCVSRFLQVSSVFGDEAENLSGSLDDPKIQTWNSQYCRGEPVVMLAQRSSVLQEQRGDSCRLGEKPLLLPVRSLKSQFLEPHVSVVSPNESGGRAGSVSSSSPNFYFSSNSAKTRMGEFGGLDPQNWEEKVKENDVLGSPVPWRSSSGRIEMKEGVEESPLYSPPPSMGESELNPLESVSFRTQTSQLPRAYFTSPSPLSSLSLPGESIPLASLSPDSQSKTLEDKVRRKVYHQSSPPPAPPQSPQFIGKPSFQKSYSSLPNGEVSSAKEMMRSTGSVLLNRASSGSQTRRRAKNGGSLMGRSVRTIRASEQVLDAAKARENGEDDIKYREELEAAFIEKKERMKNGGLLMGRSVRTTRASVPVVWTSKAREIDEESMKYKAEFEATFIEKAERTNNLIPKSITKASQPAFSEYQRQEEVFPDKEAAEADEESETEANNVEGGLEKQAIDPNKFGDGGPDVDKKADEFIAKFREQIRLQRIDSIKRTTGQLARNSFG